MDSLREQALLQAGFLRPKCDEPLQLSCPVCGTEPTGHVLAVTMQLKKSHRLGTD